MPSFSAKNFPSSSNNIRFTGAGERTDYVTCPPGEGFTVNTETTLFPTKSTPVEIGTRVWFTSTELRDHAEVKSPLRGVFGEVSLSGPAERADGYIRISHIEKPSGRNQSRVSLGEAAQKSVAAYTEVIASDRGIQTSFVSSAPPGSTKPDLIFTSESGDIQFEIKGAGSFDSTITLFDKSVRRGVPTFLDRFVLPLGFTSLDNCVEQCSAVDPTIGYAGDPGVVKSGKMPPILDVLDPDILMDYHATLKDHFANSGDNYFAVYNRTVDQTLSYHTGHGENILGLPPLPPLSQFKLATYGGPSNGATRVGVKVKFHKL